MNIFISRLESSRIRVSSHHLDGVCGESSKVGHTKDIELLAPVRYQVTMANIKQISHLGSLIPKVTMRSNLLANTENSWQGERGGWDVK